MKMVRMLKMVKESSTFSRYLSDTFKLKAGMDRLLYFMCFFFIYLHLMSCLWYFLVKLEDYPSNSWVARNDYQDAGTIEIYLASMYYVLATTTTVGYGDITSDTVLEKIMTLIIMLFGVLTFSFFIG